VIDRADRLAAEQDTGREPARVDGDEDEDDERALD
jgi:hypothetical protein